MNRVFRFTQTILILAVCLAAWLPVASREPAPVEITGIVKRAQIDRDGSVLRIYVETDDDIKYLVLNNSKGTDLINQLYSTVKITAIPRKPKRTDNFAGEIEVVEFVVVKGPPPTRVKTKPATDP